MNMNGLTGMASNGISMMSQLNSLGHQADMAALKAQAENAAEIRAQTDIIDKEGKDLGDRIKNI